ncbi:MAG: PHP domain-containing protein, partial [Notoacmeibacter sp.]
MHQLSAFSSPGQFYRGNLHTHSNRSDGVLSPEEVCRRYRAEGYDFLALTDHFVGFFGYPIVDTAASRTNNFTTILGAEVHSGAMENGELWHLLAVGLPVDFPPPNAPGFLPLPDQETGPEIAARAVEAGAFVAIAHPQWSGLTVADARSIASA